jgi:hypothetical protein
LSDCIRLVGGEKLLAAFTWLKNDYSPKSRDISGVVCAKPWQRASIPCRSLDLEDGRSSVGDVQKTAQRSFVCNDLLLLHSL